MFLFLPTLARVFTNFTHMKKVVFIFCITSFTSLLAAAKNELNTPPGDPKKEEKKESSFSLANGYFNLFNIFAITPPAPDSLRVKENEPFVPTDKRKK